MAHEILHIKDSYYFDVPKFLWRYKNINDVPAWLRDQHPQASLEQFQQHLDGKVLIPQPFGHPKNLYESQPGVFNISKFMIIEVFVAIVLVAIFAILAKRIRSGTAPKGPFWNFFESILVYLRDNVARPAIGGHDADRFLPFLWTMFFFILGCNLMGMIPWAGSPTGTFGVTLALAGLTLATVIISGMLRFGPIGFWTNQVPHMDLPLALAILLKPMIFVIEVVGLFIRHGVLAVRLLANMVAGHLVLLGIMGLAFSLEGASSNSWWITAPIAIIGSTLFNCLELFVALLQAYIFTFLSALFIGSAIHHH
jgi:F-type H+-transporting ATPase subunit a